MSNSENFAPISLVADMQQVIEEQERVIKGMARELAWVYSGVIEQANAARFNTLDTEVDFQ